jgi:hypothetical protein
VEKIIQSESHDLDGAIVGVWDFKDKGATVTITITKQTKLSGFEFDAMIDEIITDIRRSFIEQKFSESQKKLL